MHYRVERSACLTYDFTSGEDVRPVQLLCCLCCLFCSASAPIALHDLHVVTYVCVNVDLECQAGQGCPCNRTSPSSVLQRC